MPGNEPPPPPLPPGDPAPDQAPDGQWVADLGSPPAIPTGRRPALTRQVLLQTTARLSTLDNVLFLGGVLLYLVTRFSALPSFPIYFFGDEAVQALFAEDLLRQGFRSSDGTFLPVYIEAAAMRWTPLISMYFHALTLSLFGKSVWVARGTSTAISLLCGVSVSLILKEVFKARIWWTGIFLVGLIPAWFLHSRTAFETVMTTAFYSAFLLFYLLYRCRSPRFLYLAVIFAALTFYSYSNAQAIIVAASGMLFLSDLRYHFQHSSILVKGVLLAALLSLPLVAFQLNHTQAVQDHLRMVNSYWVQDLPLIRKIQLYITEYAYGLSPQYWFLPNGHDLARHRVPGIGHIPLVLLPFIAGGLVICLARLRSSPHRAVLISALAVPVGAALVDIGIARVLALIVPASLLACLGIEWALTRLLNSRWKLPYPQLAVLIAGLLTAANLALLIWALYRGPLWYRDYGLYGMQYGARQIFQQVVPHYLAQDERNQVLVTSTWANGTDNLLRFFLTPAEQERVRMDGIGSYLFRKLPLSRHEVFIMTPDEFQTAIGSGKFNPISLEHIIPYPDGRAGFYVARLSYAPGVDQVFTAEKEARQQLVESTVQMNDKPVWVRHSQIDMGTPALIFDGEEFTFMRGLEANPFILELYFDQPQPVSSLAMIFGSVNYDITARLYAAIDEKPVVYHASYRKADGLPGAEIPFPNSPPQVAWIRLEITNPELGDSANIHIRELVLRP